MGIRIFKRAGVGRARARSKSLGKRNPSRRRRLFTEQLEDRRLLATIDLAALQSGQGSTIVGADPGDESGYSVSSAGDVNADGFDDLLIGAVSADGPDNLRQFSGEAYVVFGGRALPDVIDLAALNSDGLTIYAEDDFDDLGWSVSGVGDVNGDGIDDLLVGSRNGAGRGNLLPRSGESYLIFGGASLPATIDLAVPGAADVTIYGIHIDHRAGRTVSGAGDFNGDGFNDFLIEAINDDTNDDRADHFLIFGGPTLSATIDLSALGTAGIRITGADILDDVGDPLSAAGDVNGDGFADLLIGSDGFRAHNTDRIFAGESFILFGGTSMPATIDLAAPSAAMVAMVGAEERDNSGRAVSGIGDVNGDGLDDVLISAPEAQGLSGETYIVFGETELPPVIDLGLLGTAGVTIQGIDSGDLIGYSVSGAGDVNGDGYHDLLIGAGRADSVDNTRPDAGESYLIFGSPSLPTNIELENLGAVGVTIFGIDEGDGSGRSVRGAGDVDGDGIDDILIGASRAEHKGETYLLFGSQFVNSETAIGTDGPETLAGSSIDDVIIGGGGDDVLLGRGGKDVLRGGVGNDVLAIGDVNFRRIDGGSGTDVLRLETDSAVLDLTALPDNRIEGVEQIDMTSSANTLILDSQEVLNISGESNALVVNRGVEGVVAIGGGWTQQPNETIQERIYEVFTQGAATLRVEYIPVTVDLSVSQSEGSETSATAITVTANTDSAAVGDRSVDLAVDGIDITVGDFTLSSTQITIPDGQRSGSVTFAVKDDSEIEALTETATLTIDNPAMGLTIGSSSSLEVTIIDNDFLIPLITTSVASVTNQSPLPVTVDFGGAVSGFDESDLTVTGAAVGNFQDSTGGVFTVELTPAGDGTITVEVPAGAATDLLGKATPVASPLVLISDRTAPLPVITGPASPTNSNRFDVTIAFAEDVAGFAPADITVGNGSVSNLSPIGNGSFTATIAGSNDGMVTVDVGAGVVTDNAGTLNEAATQISVLVDTTRATPVITGPLGPLGSNTFNVSIDFAELMTEFDSEDISIGNGAVSSLNDDGNGRFTATIDASGDGIVTVDVAENVASDLAGNLNGVATQFSVVLDTTGPVPTISGPASLGNVSTFDVAIDFGESVTDFVVGDITTAGGAVTAIADNGDGKFTATITVATGGRVTVGVAAGVATDSAGNANLAATEYSVTIDFEVFVPLITGPINATNSDPFEVTIDFGGTVSGFTVDDVIVGGGAASNLVDNGSGKFTATIDATTDGTVTVDVAATVAADSAGNGNSAATQYSVVVDTTAPTPTITGPASPINSEEFDVTIDFGDVVTGFVAADIAVTGASVANLSERGNGSFTATIDASSDGLVTVNVAAAVASDSAGNANLSATEYTVTIDTTALVPVITGPASPTNQSSFDVDLDFGATVNGFELGDVTVGGGAASNLVDNGNGTFTVLINAAADGAVTVDIAANVATDGAQNPNFAATGYSTIVDTTAPNATIIGPADPTSSDPFDVTIDFGETVTGFVVGDITVGGGVASNLVDNGSNNFTATIDATDDGAVTVDVAASVATDSAGNNNSAATQYLVVVDTTAPTPAITGPASPTNTDPFDVTIDFGEVVTGFVAADLAITGGSVANLSENDSGRFTATIDASSDGLVTVNVAADVADDFAGNANFSATEYTVTVDTTAFVPVITGPASPTNQSSFDVVIDFGATVNGFELGDVTVGGGAASNFVDNGNGTFTVLINATADGAVAVDIAANVATDAAGNPNFAATEYSTIVDTTAPNVTITGPSNPTSSDPFNVTIDFGEPVNGFTADDVTIGGGVVSNLVDNGSSNFTATIDATDDGAVTVDVAASVATDGAGNNNSAATQYSVVVDTAAPTPTITGPASPTNSNPFDVTIDFGEVVTGFVAEDLAVTGASVANLREHGNGRFTATIDASSDGLVTVNVAAAVASDSASNENLSAMEYAVTVDVTDEGVANAGVLDVNGDGTSNPFQDGILIVRFMFGQPDANLEDPALIPNAATRTRGADIRIFLEAAGNSVDANGDGTVNPFQDGILMVRFLLGQPDANLEDSALIPAGSTRTTGAAIRQYLITLLPPAADGELMTVPLVTIGGEGEFNLSRFDANHDGEVTMRDALFVINRLAEQTDMSPADLAIPDATRGEEDDLESMSLDDVIELLSHR